MKKELYNIVLVRDKCNKKYYVVNSKDDFEFFENFNFNKDLSFNVIGKILTVYNDELNMIQDMLHEIAINNDSITHKKISAIKIWIQYDYNLSHMSDIQKEELVRNYTKGYLNNDIM